MTKELEKLKKVREQHYPNDRPIRPLITNLTMECSMTPSSWTGKTLNSGPIYIRYRHGKFKINVGALPLDGENPHTEIEFKWKTEGHQGNIEENDMKRVLKTYVKFQVE